MLLLILFAGCLASCAAQTTVFPSSTTGISPVTPTTFPPATTITPTSGSTNDSVVVLQTALESSLELTETDAHLVLREFITSILGHNATFTLQVTDITEV